MLRRFKGGARSSWVPLASTRNARSRCSSVAGRLPVATDAIGMGLNMDVSHVAFAEFREIRRPPGRRLTIAEMA